MHAHFGRSAADQKQSVVGHTCMTSEVIPEHELSKFWEPRVQYYLQTVRLLHRVYYQKILTSTPHYYMSSGHPSSPPGGFKPA